MKEELLSISLSAAVPLRIEELRRAGGPTQGDFDRLPAIAERFYGPGGEYLLYPGGKKGETAALFNDLVDAVAVMAFCPGGIKAFGMHFEAHGGES